LNILAVNHDDPVLVGHRLMQSSPPNSAQKANWNWLAIFGVSGLCLSLVVHLLTFIGVAAQESVPATWILQLGIFPLGFTLIWRMRKWRDPNRKINLSSRGEGLTDLLKYFPTWIRFSGALLFVYVIINFLVTVPSVGSPVAAVQGMRAFSGGWLILYAIPTVFFLYVPRSTPPDSQSMA
jgi:hypothetical protein